MIFYRGRRAIVVLIIGWGLLAGNGDRSSAETPSEGQMVAVAVGAYEDKLYPVVESQILEFLKKFPESRHRLEMTYLLGRTYFRQNKFDKARETFLGLINDDAVDTADQTNGLFWLAESCGQLNRWKEAKAYYLEFVGRTSDSPFLEKSFYALGLISFQEKDLTQAETYFRQGVMAFPSGHYRFEEQYYRGLIYSQLKNYHRAVQLLREAISAPSDLADPLRREALFQLAENRLRLGQFQLALQHYEEFYGDFPQDPRAPFALYGAGWCQLETGEKEAALRTFGELVKKFPKSDPIHDALYRMGEIHLESKNYAKAREVFSQFVGQFPQSELFAPGLVNLGWSLLNLGDFDGVTQVAHRLLKLPSGQVERALPQLLLGEVHFQGGQYKDALPYFFNLLNTPSQRENALYKISRCYFYQGEYKDAITNVEILALEYPDSKKLGECLYLRGRAAISLGDIEKAIASFSEILQKESDDSWTGAAQYELAKIYYERRDQKKAKVLFTEAAQDASGSESAVLASYYLGIIYSKERNTTKALEYLDRALASNNGAIRAESHYRIGEIYFQKKAYNLSLYHFQTIVETLTDQKGWVELAFFEIGSVRLAQGESDEAERAFQRVLDLSKDPDLREASEKVLVSIEKRRLKP